MTIKEQKPNAKGHCLCGKTKVQVAELNQHVGACHCSFCTKWGGGPLMAVDCGTDVSFNDEALISVYSSSEWAERGFCKECGTHLFYRLKQNQQYIIPVGLFSDLTALHFDHQIFIDEKPEYYAFANKTKTQTGAEIFAQFAEE